MKSYYLFVADVCVREFPSERASTTFVFDRYTDHYVFIHLLKKLKPDTGHWTVNSYMTTRKKFENNPPPKDVVYYSEREVNGTGNHDKTKTISSIRAALDCLNITLTPIDHDLMTWQYTDECMEVTGGKNLPHSMTCCTAHEIVQRMMFEHVGDDDTEHLVIDSSRYAPKPTDASECIPATQYQPSKKRKVEEESSVLDDFV